MKNGILGVVLCFITILTMITIVVLIGSPMGELPPDDYNTVVYPEFFNPIFIMPLVILIIAGGITLVILMPPPCRGED